MMYHEVQFVKETALRLFQTDLSLAVCLSILYKLIGFPGIKTVLGSNEFCKYQAQANALNFFYSFWRQDFFM